MTSVNEHNHLPSTSRHRLPAKSLSKVTVSFSRTAIVVPVADEMTVADLILASSLRYNRMPVNKRDRDDVHVKYLRSLSSGGILYPGDLLTQVVDDNEQLVAVYDDIPLRSFNKVPNVQQTDGANFSSNDANTDENRAESKRSSTDSQLSYTEISHQNNICNIKIKSKPADRHHRLQNLDVGLLNDKKFVDDPCMASNSVEVKNLCDIPASSSSLIVRRGSEPTFNGQEVRKLPPSASTTLKQKIKTQREKSSSPLKLGVRWQANEVMPDNSSRKTHASSFIRGGSRKSRVSDEMLDIAAQLAEKAHVSQTQNDDHMTEINIDETNLSEEIHYPPTSPPSDLMTNIDKLVKSTSVSPLASTSSNTTTTASQPFLSDLQKGNTKRLGKLLTVELKKESDGLGFTVTSRDNARVGDNFTCIKNILPVGAALKDGRLREGDRLLKINNVSAADLPKDKVVAVLRSISEGETVKLVVSRQIDVAQHPIQAVLPRCIPTVDSDLPQLANLQCAKQRLTFDIPLNDSGSAGLGISVKGRTKRLNESQLSSMTANSSESSCGIFVKLIIHGGAAYKDGRLKVNDQLVAINGIDLADYTNKEAMNVLSSAMQRIGSGETTIRLTVLRTRISADSQNGASESEVHHRNDSATALPGTPDGAASLLLETPERYDADSSSHQRSSVQCQDDYAVIVKSGRNINGKPPLPTYVPKQIEAMSFAMKDVSGDFKVERFSSSADQSENRSEISGFEETDAKDDPFVRESRNRQSMSEKRRGASKIDPTHLATYQHIMHQRQTSAPSLVAKSKQDGLQDVPDPTSTVNIADRRTLSLESVNTTNNLNITFKRDKIAQRTLLHEQIAQNIASGIKPENVSSTKTASHTGKSLKTKLWNLSPQRSRHTYYENATPFDVFIDNAASEATKSVHPFGSGLSSSPRSTTHSKERHKRCSTSNSLMSLKNLFRFGSTGKSSKKLSISREKDSVIIDDRSQALIDRETAELSRMKAQEEQRRIRLHYERLKEQQRRYAGHQEMTTVITMNPNYSYYKTHPYELWNAPAMNNDYFMTHHGDTADPRAVNFERPQAFMAYPQPMPPPDPAPRTYNRPALDARICPSLNRYEMDYYYPPDAERCKQLPLVEPPLDSRCDRLHGPHQLNRNTGRSVNEDYFEPVPDYPAAPLYKPFVSHKPQRSVPDRWPSADSILDNYGKTNEANAKRKTPRIPPPDYEEYLRFTANRLHGASEMLHDGPRSTRFRPSSEFIVAPDPPFFVTTPSNNLTKPSKNNRHVIPSVLYGTNHGSLNRLKDSRHVTRIHF